MNNILDIILNYLTQRTTYTGLFFLLSSVLNFQISTTVEQAVATAMIGIAGLINVLHDERKAK